MAHMLTIRADQTAEMAYVGDDAWHGLGQKLQEGASIEEWRVAAGMDWEIKRAPVMFDTGDYMNPGIDHDNNVLFRSDNKKMLGLVSAKYKIVQPGEVLEFFRDLVSGNGFSLNTAGTLFDGKRFWALASIGEKACIVGNQDAVGGYLLLSTSCDGTMATEARYTTVRVVCNNTLSMAKSEKDKKIIRVSHKTAMDVKSMHDQLGIATDNFAQFMQASRKLAKVSLDTTKAREFVESLIFVPGKDYEEQSTQSKNKADFIMRLFNGDGKGADLESSRGTAWGLLNSVTEYVDHHASAHKDANGSIANARLNNALFGNGDELKTEAFERILQLA